MNDVLTEKYPFRGIWWSRECRSNFPLEITDGEDGTITRSMDDAMCVACDAVEWNDFQLATIYMLKTDDVLYIKAVLGPKSHRVALRPCPLCGGYVYTDSRTGPLHPLNGCERVFVEEVMIG